MSDLQWTMNCILFGTEIIKLVKEGKDKEVKDELKNLTSEIDDQTAEYLLTRLETLNP